MEQWDSEFKDPSMANYPYEYATDLSTQAQQWTGPPPGPSGIGTMTSAGQLFIYPQSTGSITLTHRYMKNQPDLVSPEIATTPATYAWFPYVDYLIIATAARMCDFTGDDRAPELAGRAMNMLRPHLIMEGDEQKTVHNIVLDPRRFHFSKGLKPTKASPY